MKGIQIFGMIVAVALIILSIAYPVPEKYINVSGYAYHDPWVEDRGAEYVGGDAYNFQMEATLKAGYMSGIVTMKTVTFVGGLLLMFLSLFSMAKCSLIEAQNSSLYELKRSLQQQGTSLDQIARGTNDQTALLKAISAAADGNKSTGDDAQPPC